MNPYLDADAAYDSYTIEFRDEFCIEDERVLEEILHAAQDIAYGYEMIRFSRKNVEFEVRVLRDIWEYRRCLLYTSFLQIYEKENRNHRNRDE